MNEYYLDKKNAVLCTWAPPMVGGPQSFFNIFSSIPGDRYTIITRAASIEPSHKKKDSWLSGKYYFIDNPTLSKETLIKDNETEQVSATQSSSTSIQQKTLSKINNVVSRIPFIGIRFSNAVIFFYITMLFVKKTIQASSLGENFERVLSLSDNGPALMAAYILKKRKKLPYTLFFYDLYKGNNFGPIYTLIAQVFERFIYMNASLVLVTNDRTKDFYKQRYGTKVPIEVIYNSVFPENYNQTNTPYLPVKPFTILFTGHVYWAQEQAVMNLITAMEELIDLPVQLDLYIPKGNPTIAQAIEGQANIRMTSAPQSEMPSIQSKATLLFLPLAWNTKAPDIIATATPGKFTDYLASGRPMLVHAPDYAYVSQYTKEHQIGIVVDQNDPHALAQAIRQFLEHPEVGQQYVTNAQRIFHQNHDAKKNTAKLTELLNMV